MRYAEKIGADVSGEGDLSGFADADKVSNYAAKAMAWAVDSGYILGENGTSLKPGDIASRAEVATMLMRFCEAQQDQVKKLK